MVTTNLYEGLKSGEEIWLRIFGRGCAAKIWAGSEYSRITHARPPGQEGRERNTPPTTTQPRGKGPRPLLCFALLPGCSVSAGPSKHTAAVAAAVATAIAVALAVALALLRQSSSSSMLDGGPSQIKLRQRSHHGLRTRVQMRRTDTHKRVVLTSPMDLESRKQRFLDIQKSRELAAAAAAAARPAASLARSLSSRSSKGGFSRRGIKDQMIVRRPFWSSIRSAAP